MGVKITGLDQLARHFQVLPDKVMGAMGDALYVEGETIMTRSKQIVPVDFGTLRGSGHVKRPVVQGTQATVTLGYGGAASAYAEVQHRRTDYKHRGQGQAHYLSEPVEAAERGLGERIGRRIRRTLTRKT